MDGRPTVKAAPTARDLAAADRVLAERPALLEPDPSARELQRRAFAETRAGNRRAFDLRFGLREPESRSERFEKETYDAGLDFDSCMRRIEEHVKRPLDEAMLLDYFEGMERRAELYSKLLMRALEGKDDEVGSEAEERSERAISSAAKKLCRKLPMYSTEVMEVRTRVIAVRSNDAAPPKIGNMTGDSLHGIADHLFSSAVEFWRHNVRTAHRSRVDSKYLYATSGAALFCAVWIDGEGRPSPRELMAGLRHEAARVLGDFERERARAARLARAEAERRASAESAKTASISLQAAAVSITSQSVDLHAPRPARPPTKLADAIKIAERIVKAAGGKFPGRNALVEKIPASRDTVSAAIRASPYLRARFAEYELERKSPKEILVGGDAMSQFAAGAMDDGTFERLVAESSED